MKYDRIFDTAEITQKTEKRRFLMPFHAIDRDQEAKFSNNQMKTKKILEIS